MNWSMEIGPLSTPSWPAGPGPALDAPALAGFAFAVSVV